MGQIHTRRGDQYASLLCPPVRGICNRVARTAAQILMYVVRIRPNVWSRKKLRIVIEHHGEDRPSCIRASTQHNVLPFTPMAIFQGSGDCCMMSAEGKPNTLKEFSLLLSMVEITWQ